MRGYNPNSYNMDFYFACAIGLVPGASVVKQTGTTNGALDVSALSRAKGDWADIWNGGRLYYGAANGYGGRYPWDSTGSSLYVSSNNADATSVQLALRVQLYTGVERATSIGTETIVTVTLNGQTPVQVGTYTNILNVTLVKVLNQENLVRPDTKYYIYRDPATGSPTGTTGGVPNDPTLIRQMIDELMGWSQSSCYAVPDRKVAFAYKGEAGVGFPGGGPTSTTASNVGFRVMDYTATLSNPTPNVRAKGIPLVSTANSYFLNELPAPAPAPAGSKLSVTVENILSLVEDMSFFGELQLLLIDETELPPSFLSAIGQPGY